MSRADYNAETLGISDDDLGVYEAIFTQNGMPRGLDFLRWRYRYNPAQVKGCVNVARAPDSSVAAVYSVMGVSMKVGSSAIAGAQSLDTLTDQHHRRKGLFQYLAEHNYSEVHGQGVQFVYGFPNGNSYSVFKEKLGWQMLDPVPFVFRPLRTGYFISKILSKVGLSKFGSRIDLPLPVLSHALPKGFSVRKISEFDAQHDRIWRLFSSDVKVSIDRTATYMNWRIFGRPDSEKYSVIGAFEGDRLVAEVMWCVEKKHGGRIGYLMEMLHDPAEPKAARALMSEALRQIKKAGADLVLGWNDAKYGNASVYRSAGFLSLPERYRPIELHWGVRPLDGSVVDITTNRAAWYLSYLDSDTV
jgi:Acetyltransferase (GNAT) domain